MEQKTHTIELCRGAAGSGCPHTLDVAGDLAGRLEQTVADSGWPAFLADAYGGNHHRHHAFSVRVSACPNGCARPHIADFGLIRACAPGVDPEACTGCGLCAEGCPDAAIAMTNDLPAIDRSLCLQCGHCVAICPAGAMGCRESGWRVLAGGRLGRHPKLAEELDGLYTTDQALALLDRALKLFMARYDKRTRFGALLDRLGPGALEERV